jgi:hypothetical protein
VILIVVNLDDLGKLEIQDVLDTMDVMESQANTEVVEDVVAEDTLDLLDQLAPTILEFKV